MKTFVLSPSFRSISPCKYLRAALPALLPGIFAALVLTSAPLTSQVQAQSFRFSLRAEPDVIAANGISTTSITVQIPSSSGAISAAPLVRFITTQGTIEAQAQVVGGSARALLRSSTTPGTALVTAIIGNSREQIAVEFTGDDVSLARYLEIEGAYVAYGATQNLVTVSGSDCALEFGDLRIESDVRLDVDLLSQRIWAQGNNGGVRIRSGKGAKMHELRGDRLYYDLRRRRGVMRRIDTTLGPARQEFIGANFDAPPAATPILQTPKTPDGFLPPNVAAPIVPDDSAENTEPLIESGPNPPADAPLLDRPAPVDVAPDAANSPTTQTRSVLQKRPFAAITPADTADSNNGLQVLAGHLNSETTTENTPQVLAATSNSAITPSNALQVLAASANNAITPNNTPQVLAGPSNAPADATSLAAQVKPAAGTLRERLALAQPQTGLPSGNFPVPDNSTAAPNAEDQPLREVPNYESLPAPLPGTNAPNTAKPKTAQDLASARREAIAEAISEPAPPSFDSRYPGYWVVSKKMRIFARDKAQFEHSTVYFNGQKLFSMPRYVAALDGSFSPATDLVSFNTSGGLTLNVPYYYQASRRGTGAVYFQHAPHGGFAAEDPGFALAFDQQYWLSDRSQGRFVVDQIGHAWNLNWQHKHQFSPSMRGELYLDAPRHRDAYFRSSLVKDYPAMQLGFEGLMSYFGSSNNASAQFYARLRPRQLGNSKWSYNVAANLIALRNFSRLAPSNPTNPNFPTDPTYPTFPTDPTVPGRPGGGIGLPTRPRSNSLRVAMNQSLALSRYLTREVASSTTQSSTTAVFGQTLLTTLQSPSARLWHGASLQGSLLANVYNYSDNRRGISPGLTIGVQQTFGRIGALQLNYNYDRGGTNLISNLSSSRYRNLGTNFLSGSMYLNFGQNVASNFFFTKSLTDGGLYGAGTLDFYPTQKWRLGLFSDYASFADIESYLDYGLAVGRAVGQREVSLNWSKTRGRVYLELGGAR